MRNLVLLILFIPKLLDSSLSSYKTIDSVHAVFSSGIQEQDQWKSYAKEYCFLSQELKFGFSFEFSPIAIPTFSLKNAMANTFISLELDETAPIKYQSISEEWKKISRARKNEKICFRGAYLPPQTSNDPSFILVSEVTINTKKITTERFAIANQDPR